MRERDFKPYLLGTVSEEERSAIDRQIVTDDQTYMDVLLAEDDLIEAYLRHELNAIEQTQFEQFFLADPERQQRLAVAQSLQDYARLPTRSAAAAASPSSSGGAFFRHPIWQWAVACCLLAAIVFGVKSAFFSAPREQTAQNLPLPTPLPSPGTDEITLPLAPGLVRAAQTDALILLTPNIGTIKLKLYLEDKPFSRYEASIIPDDESEKKVPGQWQVQSEKEQNFVVVSLSSQMLDRGGYTLVLYGITASGSEIAAKYVFHIRRQP